MRLKVSSCIVITLLLLGCNGEPPPSLFDPYLYNGMSASQKLIGSQDSFFCSDKKFDSMVCMDSNEIPNIIKDRNKLIEACLQWKQ